HESRVCKLVVSPCLGEHVMPSVPVIIANLRQKALKPTDPHRNSVKVGVAKYKKSSKIKILSSIVLLRVASLAFYVTGMSRSSVTGTHKFFRKSLHAVLTSKKAFSPK
ncbi:jg26691, partial [Pararge aegeria aegeria]